MAFDWNAYNKAVGKQESSNRASNKDDRTEMWRKYRENTGTSLPSLDLQELPEIPAALSHYADWTGKKAGVDARGVDLEAGALDLDAREKSLGVLADYIKAAGSNIDKLERRATLTGAEADYEAYQSAFEPYKAALERLDSEEQNYNRLTGIYNEELKNRQAQAAPKMPTTKAEAEAHRAQLQGEIEALKAEGRRKSDTASAHGRDSLFEEPRYEYIRANDIAAKEKELADMEAAWYQTAMSEARLSVPEELQQQIGKMASRELGLAEQRELLDAMQAAGYTKREAQEIVEYAQQMKDRAHQIKRSEEAVENARERSTFTNWLFGTGAGLASGVGLLDIAEQNIENTLRGENPYTGEKTPVNYNTGAQSAYLRGQDIAEGQELKMVDKFYDRYLPKMGDEEKAKAAAEEKAAARMNAFNLATSMGQSAAVAGLTAMGVPAAMLLLSGSAGTATAQEYHAKGYSDGAALGMGLMAAAAEYVTEKVSIDALFKMSDAKSVRAVVGNVLTQMLTEGSEEVSSSLITAVSDAFVSALEGKDSEFRQLYDYYRERSGSDKEAFGRAVLDWAKQLGADFLGGAISGGIFGAGGTAFMGARTASADARLGRAIQSAEQAETVQELFEGLTQSERWQQRIKATEVNAENARELGQAARKIGAVNVDRAVSERLRALGDHTAQGDIVTAITAEARGERLTANERAVLKRSRYGVQVAEELKTAMEGESTDANRWATEAMDAERSYFEKLTTRSQANKIVKDDGLKAEFEEKTGVTLEGPLGEQARTVMAESQKKLEAIDAEPVAVANNATTTEETTLSKTETVAETKSAPVQQNAAESAINAEEEGVNEQSAFEGQENRADGIGAGGEAGAVSIGKERTVAGTGSEVGAGVGAAEAANLRKVSPAELGIKNGGKKKTIELVEVATLEGDAKAAAERVRAEGLKPVAIRGQIAVGKGEANAYIQGTKIYFSVDAKDAAGKLISPEKLVKHEIYHNQVRQVRGLLQEGRKIVRQSMSAERFDRMKKAYLDAYSRIQDFTDWTAEEIAEYLEEEICADAIAGINYFSESTELTAKLEKLTEQMSATEVEVEAEQDTTGPPEGKASFAGKLSENADIESLTKAEEMEAAGVDAETIRQETEWFRGRDGEWRYEISDESAAYARLGDAQFRKDHPEYARYQELLGKFLSGEIAEDEVSEMQELRPTWEPEAKRLAENVVRGNAKLRNIMEHDKLYAAYPEIAETRVRFADLSNGEKGYYHRRDNEIVLDSSLRKNTDELMNTLLHEVQHRIQAEEGFARGASEDYWQRKIDSGYLEEEKRERIAELDRKYRELWEAAPEELKNIVRQINQAKLAEDWDRVDELENGIYDGEYADLYTEIGDADFDRRTARERVDERTANDLYLNTYGEVEARETAARRRMTAEERKKTPPRTGGEDIVFAESEVSFQSKNGNEYDEETANIKEQLRANAETLNAMEVISRKSVPDNLRRKADAANWAIEQLKSVPKVIDRMNFGKVDVGPDAIRNAVKYADTPAEKAALICVPDVVKRGKEIARHKDHKGRKKETVTFAGPVELNGIRGNMAVVVSLNGNKFYTHRILTPDGNIFVFENKDAKQESQRGVTVSGSLANATSFASAETVPQPASTVNSEEKGNASVSVTADLDADAGNYGEIDSSIRVPGRVEKREATRIAVTEGYPSLLNDEGEAVTAIPGWTWVRANDRGNYGVVVGKDGNMLEVFFSNKEQNVGRYVKMLPRELTAVEAQYSDSAAADRPLAEPPAWLDNEEDLTDPMTDEEFNAMMQEADDRESGRIRLAEELIGEGEVNTAEEAPDQIREVKELLEEDADLRYADVDVNPEDYSFVKLIAPGKGGNYNKTAEQNMDDAAGGNKKLRKELQEKIVAPVRRAVDAYNKAVNRDLRELHDKMKELGIKKGSRENLAIVWYGEGIKQGKGSGLPPEATEEYDLAKLQAEFPQTWEKVVEAEKYFRARYDKLLQQQNASREEIYPKVVERAEADILKYNTIADEIEARATKTVFRLQSVRQSIRSAEARLDAARTENARQRAVEQLERLRAQEAKLEAQDDRYRQRAARTRSVAVNIQRKIDSGEILKNKFIRPRKDYFHHGREMATGLEGLFNTLTASADIDSGLSAMSEFTKPKAKWQGHFQQRSDAIYNADAIGDMQKYIQAAEYVIHIDKATARLRKQIQVIAELTQKERNANRMLTWMADWTNQITGKTNPMDRFLTTKLVGRKALKVLKWVNGRVKSNAIMMNPRSALAQFYNLPVAAMHVKNPADWRAGAGMLIDAFSGEGSARHVMSQSGFLTGRYEIDKAEENLDGSKLKDIKKFSAWMMRAGDEAVARLTWCAAYEQGLRENVADPIAHADDITRRSVAGRGIGEVPLNQDSEVTKLFAPFQVEVNNLWQVMKSKTKEKDLGALALFALLSWVMNAGARELFGSDVSYDPINSAIEAVESFEEEDTAWDKLWKIVGRTSGELISNMPYGAPVAQYLIPEDSTREKLFGDSDPTRFGTGNIGLNMLTAPLLALINGDEVTEDLVSAILNVGLPSGGKEAVRILDTLQLYGIVPEVSYSTDEGLSVRQQQGGGASYTDGGSLRFATEATFGNLVQSMLFGEFATKEGKEYLESGGSPRGENTTALFQKLTDEGVGTLEAMEAIEALSGIKADKKNGKAVTGSRNVKSLEWLAASGMSWEAQAELYKGLIASDTQLEKIEAMENAGMGWGYISDTLVEYYETGFNGDLTANEKATSFAAWAMDNLNAEQAQLVRDEFTYSSGFVAKTDKYDALVEAGLEPNAASGLVMSLNMLTPEPGKASVTDTQRLYLISAQKLADAQKYGAAGTYMDTDPGESKFSQFEKMEIAREAGMDYLSWVDMRSAEDYLDKARAVTESGIGEDEQLDVMETFLNDSQFFKLETATGYGVTPKMWTDFKRKLPEFDADGNENYKQAEVKACIDSIPGISDEERAILWQMETGGKNNPYDRTIGTEFKGFYEKWNEKKEAEKKAKQK